MSRFQISPYEYEMVVEYWQNRRDPVVHALDISHSPRLDLFHLLQPGRQCTTSADGRVVYPDVVRMCPAPRTGAFDGREAVWDRHQGDHDSAHRGIGPARTNAGGTPS